MLARLIRSTHHKNLFAVGGGYMLFSLLILQSSWTKTSLISQLQSSEKPKGKSFVLNWTLWKSNLQWTKRKHILFFLPSFITSPAVDPAEQSWEKSLLSSFSSILISLVILIKFLLVSLSSIYLSFKEIRAYSKASKNSSSSIFNVHSKIGGIH